jgi:hypothetical protein
MASSALQTPQWRGGLSGGIWQNVRFVALTGASYIKDVFTEPNISDNAATFHLTLDHTAVKGEHLPKLKSSLSEAVNKENKVAFCTVSSSNCNRASIAIKSNGANSRRTVLVTQRSFSVPSHCISLKNQQNISDDWHHRFGLRALTIKDQDFYLNGKPDLHQSHFF